MNFPYISMRVPPPQKHTDKCCCKVCELGWIGFKRNYRVTEPMQIPCPKHGLFSRGERDGCPECNGKENWLAKAKEEALAYLEQEAKE